ncbi:hypothetical protein DM02DRAFT_733141 [Periconia macrospinosa]|uniref:Uncharacterized protein n=1 Tax=Periconia macrospinosa TaxID=97972 RepID=A0A2V1D748_9PLEO|nr:hypothetical protein DM02DRAFT_733141 [Periconia macrospinosa]
MSLFNSSLGETQKHFSNYDKHEGDEAPGILRMVFFVQWILQRVKSGAIIIRDWAVKNPGKTITILFVMAVAIIVAVAVALIVVVAAIPVAIYLTPVILSALGFTSAGIAAGSIAASIQAAIGLVTAGSAFAVLQSAGAGGAGLASINSVIGTAGAIFAFCNAVVDTAAAAAASFLVSLSKAAQEDQDGGKNEDSTKEK